MDRARLHEVTVSFEACENCGHEGGFHIHLERRPRSQDHPKPAAVILKCPNCQQTYDVGWLVDLSLT